MNYQQGLKFANQPDKNTKLWGAKQINYLITDFFCRRNPCRSQAGICSYNSNTNLLYLLFVACHDFVAPAFAVWYS